MTRGEADQPPRTSRGTAESQTLVAAYTETTARYWPENLSEPR